MKIGIDISPVGDARFLQHRVRGTGSYIEQLKVSLQKYYPNNTYTLFTRGEKLPKNIDLVHYPYFEPFFLTLPLKKPFPTVVTIHDLTPFVFPEHFAVGMRGSIKWFIQKMSLQGTARVITDSEASKKDIVRFAGVPENRVHVVYLAASDAFHLVKDKELLEKTRKKYKLPAKFVLYVGDVTWNKNLPKLLEAIKKTDLTLVMVGKTLIEDTFDKSNPWNKDLVKIQKLVNGDERIIRLGFVSTEDLVVLYNLASVFVIPSIYEGFGLPVLEAMASGTPVVTTRMGSLPEVTGDAAYLVDPYDIESIANGIREVLSSPELQGKLSRKGLQQAKKFSWKKTAEDTVSVYEKTLEK